MRPEHWIIEKGTVLLKDKPLKMWYYSGSNFAVSLSFKYFWMHLNFYFQKELCLRASVLFDLFGPENSCTCSNFLCFCHCFTHVKIVIQPQVPYYLSFISNSLPMQLQRHNWSGTYNCYNSTINSWEILNFYFLWLYTSVLYFLKGLSNVDNTDVRGLRLI